MSQSEIDYLIDCLMKVFDQRANQATKFGEWQICPKCLGVGTLPTYYQQYTQTSLTNVCDICNGSKIIPKPILNELK